MTTTTTTTNDNTNSNTTSSPLSFTSLNTRVPNVNKKSKTLIQGISKQRFLALKPRPSQHASITFIQNQYEEGIGITCVNFQHKNAAKHISKHDMIKVLHLSQIQACKILNCSMSTLKRKFYQMKTELGVDKWPQYFQDVRHLPIFKQMYPMSLNFILNHDEQETSTNHERNNNEGTIRSENDIITSQEGRTEPSSLDPSKAEN